MRDFVAIDFETANSSRHSACQIGICQVQGGQICDQRSWLIKPTSPIFTFSELHGITYSMVKNQLTFLELWPLIKPYLDKKIIAAHNAQFDVSVLSALLAFYRLSPPEFQVIDSLEAARKNWPCLENHRLSTVSQYLQIELNHHDALSDARACAEIILRADWNHLTIKPYKGILPKQSKSNNADKIG